MQAAVKTYFQWMVMLWMLCVCVLTVAHQCSPACLQGYDNPNDYKGYNPLCIPMEFGWTRYNYWLHFQWCCLVQWIKLCAYKSTDSQFTLGMVGVVRVLDADAHNTSRGPKCQILTKNPQFFFFQNKVRCPPCLYKKFKRKICSQFWDIRQNIFDPVCPVVKFQKNRKLRSGVVLLCWILLRMLRHIP